MQPLYELEIEPSDDVCRAIGRHVASLIPDGATLQNGHWPHPPLR